jgi:hypothetical protein
MPEADPELLKMLDGIKEEEPLPVVAPSKAAKFIDPVTVSPSPTKLPAELTTEEKTEDVLGIKALLMGFGKIAQDIINKHATDREQVDQALKYFEQQVKAMQTAGIKLPSSLVEGWVSLLKIKADINSNAPAVLDSYAKLLAAAKNNNIVINMTGMQQGSGEIDLDKVLSQPAYDDEN